MEYLFSKLKKLDIVSVTDGKNLGKLCDISFTLPDGKIKGFFATGSKGFKLTKSEVFISLCDLVKVGEDTILVKSGKPSKDGKPCPPNSKGDNNHGCPPNQPPCPPGCPPNQPPFPPGYTPEFNNRPPFGQPPPEFNRPHDPRRSFDDYE